MLLLSDNRLCESMQKLPRPAFFIFDMIALPPVHAKMASASMLQYTHVSAGIQDSPELGGFSSVHTSNTSPRFLSKTLNALHLQEVCILTYTSDVPALSCYTQRALVPFSGAGLLIPSSEITDPLSSALAHVLHRLKRNFLLLVLHERAA